MWKKRIRKYKVAKDVDTIAPSWLAIQINEGTIKLSVKSKMEQRH